MTCPTPIPAPHPGSRRRRHHRRRGAGAGTVPIAGTYAPEVIAAAARSGLRRPRASASEVFRSEIELRPEEASTAPAAMRVAFGDDAPVLLVATRGETPRSWRLAGSVLAARAPETTTRDSGDGDGDDDSGLAGFSEATPRPPRRVRERTADHDRDPPVIASVWTARRARRDVNARRWVTWPRRNRRSAKALRARRNRFGRFRRTPKWRREISKRVRRRVK